MLASVRAIVIGVVVLLLVEMRIASAFAPRLFHRTRLLRTPAALSTTQRCMSNNPPEVAQERSEEEKAAIKAAREARK